MYFTVHNGITLGGKMQCLNGLQTNYVKVGYRNYKVRKISVTICNFPIDFMKILIYNAYKKEHRNAVAE